MRKTEQTPEPSIEEILASIRRIIADDGAPTAGPAFDPYATANDGNPGHAASAAAGKPVTVAQPIGGASSSDAVIRRTTGKAVRDDEILELTEDFMLEELGGPDEPQSEYAAFEPAPEMVSPFRPAPVTAPVLAFAPPESKTDADIRAGASQADPAPVVCAAPVLTPPPAPAPAHTQSKAADTDAPPLPSDEELAEFNSVLSSVVAEMQRITDVKGYEAPAGFFADMPAPKTAFPSVTAPTPVAAAPVAPKASAAPMQKPVWSARHHSDAAKARSANGSTETSASALSGRAEAAPAAQKPAQAPAPASTPTPPPPPVSAAQPAPSPLMEAIATSLVTALADSTEQHERRTAAITEDALPEDAFAPDMDDAPFAAPVNATPPASAVFAAPAPTAKAVSRNGTQTTLPAGLEDGVRDMLKPMLAAWLDENLPRIVEKVLRDEMAARGPLSLHNGKPGSERG